MLFSNFSSANDKYLAIMGAGAEDRSKMTTIFDNGFDYLNVYAKSSVHKKIDVLFNGGHRITEDKVKRYYPQNSASFTNKNLNNLLADYKQKILNGTIKPGDQILLSLDTHGAPRTSDQSHKIATVPETLDKNNPQSYDLFSMDQLKELMSVAKSKKVKLGILDLGCYSGNTLSLDDGHACIISSSDKDLFSFKGEGTFTNNFFKYMRSGKNLESVFLEARKSTSGDRSLPLISTDESKTIYSQIISKITPYFRFGDDGREAAPHTNLEGYINLFSDASMFCKREYDFKSLISDVEKIERLDKTTRSILGYDFTTDGVNLSALKDMLIQYKKSQDGILKEYYRLKSKMAGKVKVAFKNFEGKNAEQEYSVESIIASDYKSYLAKELSNKKPNKMLVSLYGALATKKDDLLKASPDLKNILSKMQGLSSTIRNTERMSVVIATQERMLFDTSYRIQKQKIKKPNPCRDFTL